VSCDLLRRVVVKNHAEFKWAVSRVRVRAGHYEIGVIRGTVAVMLTRFSDVHARPNNKKRESIWREYRRWVRLTTQCSGRYTD